jgi:hydroxypyruvate reductase
VTRALARDPIETDVRIVAAGKAAPRMASAAIARLGPRVRDALIVAPPGAGAIPAGTLGDSRVRRIVGGHPVPTAASEEAGRRALAIAASTPAGEQLLVLLSGGASAMMAVPAGTLTLAHKQGVTGRLLKAGADIHQLNTVRKHLSAIKGGWLGVTSAAPCRTLAISDVVGDDLSVIGSGPTVPDATTFADALAIVDRFGGARAHPPEVIEHLRRGAGGDAPETPKPHDERFARHQARVIGSRFDAMRGARDEAASRGYEVVVWPAPVVGEARVAAAQHLAAVADARPSSGAPPICIVSSGETTVTVAGSGAGGRNQEFALAAVEPLAGLGAAALASVGTDGVDGPTDAAGAIVDAHTYGRARAAGLQPSAFLDANDAYRFFSSTDELLRTGPTGTNVGDLQVVLLA